MGLFTKEIKTMDDLYLHVLQDIYYAEQQIVAALPDMIAKATNRELAAAFRAHLKETEGHVARLEQAFALLGKSPKATKCPAINGIIAETNEIAGEVADKQVLDAALAAAAQAVEHYEITRYGTLVAWSKATGNAALGRLFNATLREEKAADVKLSRIATGKVNARASGRASRTTGRTRTTATRRTAAKPAGRTTRKAPGRTGSKASGRRRAKA